jgi:hypothetical protein
MSLPSIIIGILLSAVAIGIGVSYFGDTYSEGSAMAAASTLASQGQQINEAADTFAAKNSGAQPTGMTDLTTDSEYLSSDPSTGIDNVTWTYGSIGTGSVMVALTTDGVPDAVCTKAMENAGFATDVAAGDIPADADAALTSGELYGCYAGTTDNFFFAR